MSKFTPTVLTSTYGAVAALNSNFDDIQDLFELCVFRDGTSPNNMLTDLDMDGNRVRNLAAPSASSDAVRLVDLAAYTAASEGLDDLLATGAGAGLVGFENTGPDAVVRTVEDKLGEFVSVKDFGAVGDGTTDDTDAIVAAINSGASRVWVPAGSYQVWEDLGDLDEVELIGEGFMVTEFIAMFDMDQMITVKGQHNKVSGIHFNCNEGLAGIGIKMNACNGTVIERVKITEALYDGIQFTLAPGNNSDSNVRNCLLVANGTRVTGVCSTAGDVVTFEGGMTTTGLREDFDMIRIGAQGVGKAYTVAQVLTSTTVRVSSTIGTNASGTACAKLYGNGIMVAANGDNSIIICQNNVIQNSAGAGIKDQALYGVYGLANIYEQNEYGRTIGISDGVQPNGSFEVGGYFEQNYSNAVLVEAAVKPTVSPALVDTEIEDAIRVPTWGVVDTPMFSYGGRRIQGRTALQTNLSATPLDVEFGTTYAFNQSSGSPNITINLPSVGAVGSAKRDFLANTNNEITFVFTDIGGKNATFKSSEVNVNGVTGTTGIVHTTNYTTRRARYIVGLGWIIS